MAGDDVVKHPTFNATRDVSIQGRPEEIWPWLVQLASRGRVGTATIGLIISASRVPIASSQSCSSWQWET
jgi:hypothetical protein